MEQKEKLTVQEVADLLEMSGPAIYKMIREERIPYIQEGKRFYFLKKEIEDWKDNGRVMYV